MLLISGWVLALGALVLLHGPGSLPHASGSSQATELRLVFVLAALAVEALGLGLLLSGYKAALGFARTPEPENFVTLDAANHGAGGNNRSAR